MEIDRKNGQELILWGAGKKGKEIAKLIPPNMPFSWITNNSKKIGRDIYGHLLKSVPSVVPKHSQIILAVAGQEQLEIKQKLEAHPNVFYFC